MLLLPMYRRPAVKSARSLTITELLAPSPPTYRKGPAPRDVPASDSSILLPQDVFEAPRKTPSFGHTLPTPAPPLTSTVFSAPLSPTTSREIAANVPAPEMRARFRVA